ncbi:homoserine kinase [Sporanaerobium hydrogeniformans]|uniref:Homoserine kinase n=1 Tax=Sporanaerobium hydrogeniformans TaxID=3072179 RepID=A0AC61DGL1_9FIRM|nr:homoserine kinase [Sporanaerobium hydrogeniformans]PHV72020.1 homoserine kinase [Sporanaerobium hydrogeniformans]
MIKVKVPATTANMGPGFDSIGMALSLYNIVYAEEIERGLEIIIQDGNPHIPKDERNLIYKTIEHFYKVINKPIPGMRIVQQDSIPHTRGLGSSAACIVAGLHIANAMSQSFFSKEELVQMAAQLEGHPDNTTPALLGGMTIGAMNEEDMKYVKVRVPENIHFAVMIPDFTLSTELARSVLPKEVSLKDAVFNASRAGLLAASMITGDVENLSLAMEDCLHEPYRSKLIPHMDEILKTAKIHGAKGAYLSGAGPTLIAVVKNVVAFRREMVEYLAGLENNWQVQMLQVDNEGAKVWINEELRY